MNWFGEQHGCWRLLSALITWITLTKIFIISQTLLNLDGTQRMLASTCSFQRYTTLFFLFWTLTFVSFCSYLIFHLFIFYYMVRLCSGWWFFRFSDHDHCQLLINNTSSDSKPFIFNAEKFVCAVLPESPSVSVKYSPGRLVTHKSKSI